jgi:hypothetical protein
LLVLFHWLDVLILEYLFHYVCLVSVRDFRVVGNGSRWQVAGHLSFGSEGLLILPALHAALAVNWRYIRLAVDEWPTSITCSRHHFDLIIISRRRQTWWVQILRQQSTFVLICGLNRRKRLSILVETRPRCSHQVAVLAWKFQMAVLGILIIGISLLFREPAVRRHGIWLDCSLSWVLRVDSSISTSSMQMLHHILLLHVVPVGILCQRLVLHITH